LRAPSASTWSGFGSRSTSTIVHGRAGEVIPRENALRLARAVDGALHLIHAEHRLAGVHDLLAALLRDVLGSIES